MPTETDNAPAQLAQVPLRQELAGRLRNLSKLKHWQMAVAEAVQNSMDAIVDSGRPGGITVDVERANDLASSGSGKKLVKSIAVRE